MQQHPPSQAQTEALAMAERYARRSTTRSPAESLFGHFASAEREAHQLQLLHAHFGADLSALKVLEVGAGAGNNLYFFLKQGLAWQNLFANELLPERISQLQSIHPYKANILEGDLLNLSPTHHGQYDLVFQSVVFSSVLNPEVRVQLAQKMHALLKPSGAILWYDFTINNPRNPDVKKVSAAEVKRLFSEFAWTWKRVTLLPPLARKVGMRYPLINSMLPFARTHVLGLGRKKRPKLSSILT
jgi:phospholipid N-methyltransferase